MRVSSLISTASVAIAITSVSFVIGSKTAEPLLLVSPLPTSGIATEPTADPSGQTPAELAAPSENQASKESPTGSTSEPAPTTTADPAPAATAAEPAPTSVAQPTPVSIASDVITYKYGVVQVEVVKTGDLITDVLLLQGDASYGRDAAYQTLIQATLQYQGTNYGNVSGATFTTEAFKLAVESALSKP